MKYSEIADEIVRAKENLSNELKIVEVLKDQHATIGTITDKKLVICYKDSKEVVRELSGADKTVMCKQIDKEINTSTAKIGKLNIYIDELKKQQRDMYEKGEN